jgi:hypothetical protein
MFTRTKLNMDIVNVWLLFGTMHLVSRVLSAQASGTEVWDIDWAQQVLFLLLGLTTYYIIVNQFMPITSPNKVIRSVIEDILMFGTAFVVVRVLSGGDLTDQSWIKTSGAMIAGLVSYDVLLHRFVPNNTRFSPVMHTVTKYGTMFAAAQVVDGSLMNSNWQIGTAMSLAGFAAYELVVRPLARSLFGIVGTTNELESSGLDVWTTQEQLMNMQEQILDSPQQIMPDCDENENNEQMMSEEEAGMGEMTGESVTQEREAQIMESPMMEESMFPGINEENSEEESLENQFAVMPRCNLN